MKTRKLPSPRVLRRLLEYIPETGELRWKERPAWMFQNHTNGDRKMMAGVWNGRYANQKAFRTVRSNGYLWGCILNRGVMAHRVIFALACGAWPKGQIDHLNHDRQDNRLINLRVVAHSENGKNQKLRSTNSSGVNGVSWSKDRGKWVAQMVADSKPMMLGRFANFEDAVVARKSAERKYGFHPNHGQSRQEA